MPPPATSELTFEEVVGVATDALFFCEQVVVAAFPQTARDVFTHSANISGLVCAGCLSGLRETRAEAIGQFHRLVAERLVDERVGNTPTG